ncbi:hypothetical protein [Streptomyces sp. NPDC126514]|uniref:hypothetical protein n=1 Tax=Streptomyces sp. NPDC126514 TaxID=3155210 RepID=UPI00332ECB58
MTTMATTPSTRARTLRQTLDEGHGVLRLMPTWVPRTFSTPGHRLRLHPDDHYALGPGRGALTERWLASTTQADNGPDTPDGEGISRVLLLDGQMPLTEAVDILGADVIGPRLAAAGDGWPVYAKFYDYQGALPFHIHLNDTHAAAIGQRGGAEALYFPPELNPHTGKRPIMFLGLQPHVTPKEFLARIADFSSDNHITELSQAFRVRPGTGWNIPPGVLHAAGSLCTYEVEQASDTYAMCESVADDQPVPESLLWKDVPPEHRGNHQYILDMLDWQANTDPDTLRRHHNPPLPVTSTRHDGLSERWIAYSSPFFSAKEVTLAPGATAPLTDPAAYGAIAVRGHGRFGPHPVAAPTLIRFGNPTEDEFFVSETAATAGVPVTNHSTTEPLVLLQHFGPANPALPIP